MGQLMTMDSKEKPKERTLTRIDKKLLQVAANLGQDERVDIRRIADEIGRSPQFVYQRLQDPEFRSMFLEAIRMSLMAETPAILQKFVEMAKAGSFKHGKLILEIAGAHEDGTKVTHEGSVTHIGEVPFADEQQRGAFIRATLTKYLPATDERGNQSE